MEIKQGQATQHTVYKHKLIDFILKLYCYTFHKQKYNTLHSTRFFYTCTWEFQNILCKQLLVIKSKNNRRSTKAWHSTRQCTRFKTSTWVLSVFIIEGKLSIKLHFLNVSSINSNPIFSSTTVIQVFFTNRNSTRRGITICNRKKLFTH